MNLNILKCILLNRHTYSKQVKVNKYKTEKCCIHCSHKITTYNSSLTMRKNMIIAQLKNDLFCHAKVSLDKLIEELGYK